MDWGVVVELVKALAWPVVVIVGIVKVGRIKFTPLLDRVRKLKIGENEIELGEVPKLPPPPPPLALPSGDSVVATATVTEATGVASGTNTTTEEAPTASPLPIPPAPTIDLGSAAEPALIEFAPAGAIVNAWARFEDIVRRAASRLELQQSPRTGASVMLILAALRDLHVIAGDTEEFAQSLRHLRNEVLHGVRVPTTDAAHQFVETVEGLIDRVEMGADVVRLRQLREYLGNPPPAIVRVGLLSGGSTSSTAEAARGTAEARRGQWAAKAFATIVVITERDASLLLADGATVVRDIEGHGYDEVPGPAIKRTD